MLLFLALLTIILMLIGTLLLQLESKRAIEDRIAFIKGNDIANIPKSDDPNQKENLYMRFVEPRMKQFRRSFNRSKNKGVTEKIERKLLQAGSPYNMSPFDFRVVQMILFIVLPMLTIALVVMAKPSFSISFLLVIGSLVAGGSVPHLFLKSQINARAKKAVKELPDFIDLLAVSMEAGLGFDQALSQVVLKKQGVLADEFQRCLEELRLGKTRREALSGVRERLDVDDVKLLVGSVIQAEQLGVGMVQILRIQSDEVRQRRKQRAEEQAMKAPIKMLFPLVFFIFPCIFIILLGPVMLQLMETFK
ncbi:type II secretion system F family protein [Lederbergia panacisoli]|uniref:type II secretion system F family protein n=1 Tax=Lederbergia panacisoli TaxID=1255251 RepID=UPI00214CE6C4|nr:type II secretion system F family protein [Lederbergia panacisoli]MCR2823189.1 type II secretion system F family protein [Lederbergia panacisoli]